MFAFAHNTSVNYTTGKTPYENFFAAKRQISMSVKLGVYRNKHKFCCSEICADLLPHTHDESSMKYRFLQKLLRPQLSQALLDPERVFRLVYSSTFEQCREQRAPSHAYRNKFKAGNQLDIGQKVLHDWQDLSKSQKLQRRRLGPFTDTKRITSTTSQIQDDEDPSVMKTVHRNHLVYYYAEEESLPAVIEKQVPHDQQHDDFSEQFSEQRIGK